MAILWYGVCMVLLWAGCSIYLIWNSRRIAYLKSKLPLTGGSVPAVAVVIAVRNEEAGVEEALRSVCRLNYPSIRIVVVDDRSTDHTPAILQRVAKDHAGIEILTIEALPQGWLGKNHALYQGYRVTGEEWLLFTDADVVYEPDALRKAMHVVQAQRLDHLTALPQVTSRSWLFRSVMTTFALMLNMRLRPWNAADPSSTASIGVGAFNLVKRTAYEKAGTHTIISLRPDDDLKLGERIKKAGLRQGVVYAQGEIWLEWYSGLGEFVRGLMKNTFSVSNYRLPLALAYAFATLLLIVLPVPLLLVSGFPNSLMGIGVLLAQTATMIFTRGAEGRWWYALLVPFAGSVMVYILVRSAWLTIRQGGIYWRNSFYSLAELRKQS